MVGGAGYDEPETETEPPWKFYKPAVRIMFQVTEIVRFLLERGLRFRSQSKYNRRPAQLAYYLHEGGRACRPAPLFH